MYISNTKSWNNVGACSRGMSIKSRAEIASDLVLFAGKVPKRTSMLIGRKILAVLVGTDIGVYQNRGSPARALRIRTMTMSCWNVLDGPQVFSCSNLSNRRPPVWTEPESQKSQPR